MNEQQKQEKERRQGLSSCQIRDFYKETIKDLRRTVSLSRKGKPRKQPWGMHIENDTRKKPKKIPPSILSTTPL